MLEITKQLKFDKNGLIPAVVQDYNDGAILMVAYMNAESFEKTLKTKKATYWSRSRQKFWVKGEESGNIQKVKEIYYDCDADCILLKVIHRTDCQMSLQQKQGKRTSYPGKKAL